MQTAVRGSGADTKCEWNDWQSVAGVGQGIIYCLYFSKTGSLVWALYRDREAMLGLGMSL